MAKEYAKAFYNSKRWQRVQAAYMATQHYICERCDRPARVVHHKKYITPDNIHDPAITLDFCNLEALCMDCHAEEHAGGAVCAPGLYFDENGELRKR